MFEYKNGQFNEIQCPFSFTSQDLKNLGINKYKDLLRRTLGYIVFCQNDPSKKLIRSEKGNEIAYLTVNDKIIETYYVTQDDFSHLRYSDDKGNSLDVTTWLNNNFFKYTIKSIQVFG